jgi:mRNA-degrading endonuclease RelE of RelBE toxin-antitoxin system
MTEVKFTGKAAKQAGKLPAKVREILMALVQDIVQNGPVRGNWSNYSQLSTGEHHCHIKKGRPTYVVKWVVVQKNLVHIVYAGTHEKAGY